MSKDTTTKTKPAASADTKPAASNRRKFLTGAAATAAGATAAIAAPNISRAQTVTLKMQGAWGQTDIFNDMAMQYVDRVNAMAGGRLQIDYLVAGAVVKPFSVMDAVHEGVLDGGHHVTVYWYGKSKTASLFGTGPYWGWNAAQGLAWIHHGGGQELYNELLDTLGLNVVGFFAMPMPTQPLGWFKNKVDGPDEMVGMKYRTVGLAADLFQKMGLAVAQLPGGEILPAMERGVIDAFEFNNPTSDSRFGAQDVAKNYMLGSYHQATEYFEIIFNKDKFNSLPAEHQAILEYAAEAASTANLALGLDNYSSDLVKLQTESGVQVWRTPQSILDAQLKAWDELLPDLMADPFFAKVVESQKAWVDRVVFYEMYNAADQRLAYEHFFKVLDI
jgi:TRAP-type mannitol/chloroaromatic compound transport system substrate-binding protein